MRTIFGILFLVVVGIPSTSISIFGQEPTPSSGGPNAESALATEMALNNAMLGNDADAVGRILDSDWAVINTNGGLGDGIRNGFLDAIRSGTFSRKTMVLTEPRIRVYGNIAVITSHLSTSGSLGGKVFNVQERQTDVLIWRKGVWKSVLLHETKIPDK